MLFFATTAKQLGDVFPCKVGLLVRHLLLSHIIFFYNTFINEIKVIFKLFLFLNDFKRLDMISSV